MSSCARANDASARHGPERLGAACRLRPSAVVVLLLAGLMSGCQSWPVLVRNSRTSPRQTQGEQLVQWDGSAPAAPQAVPRPQSPPNVSDRDKGDQYVSSIDSLADRVARYQQQIEMARSKAGAPKTEMAASEPEAIDEPLTPVPTLQAEAPKAAPTTPIPPTVVAVDIRPGRSAEALVVAAHDTGKSNRPLQAASSAEKLDLGQVLETLREQVARQPNRADKQFVLRLLYLLEGRDELARAVFEGTDAELQRAVQVLVEAMIAARPGEKGDPTVNADRTLRAIDEFRRILSSHATLRIPTLRFCQRVVSFGVYDPVEPLAFPAGREHAVILYSEVENFRSRPTVDGQFETLLTFHSEIYSTAGHQVYTQPEQKVRDVCRKVRNDFFVRQQLHLPATLALGHYVTKVAITDVLAGKRAEARLIFQITSPGASVSDVAPGATTTAPSGR